MLIFSSWENVEQHQLVARAGFKPGSSIEIQHPKSLIHPALVTTGVLFQPSVSLLFADSNYIIFYSLEIIIFIPGM